MQVKRTVKIADTAVMKFAQTTSSAIPAFVLWHHRQPLLPHLTFTFCTTYIVLNTVEWHFNKVLTCSIKCLRLRTEKKGLNCKKLKCKGRQTVSQCVRRPTWRIRNARTAFSRCLLSVIWLYLEPTRDGWRGWMDVWTSGWSDGSIDRWMVGYVSALALWIVE